MPHIVITGASSGIGNALAAHFLGAGHRVTTISRSDGQHPAIAELAASATDRHQHIECDVGDQGSVETMADTLLREDRPIDCLINNAGTTGNRGEEEPLHKQLGRLDGEALLQVFRVNSIGPLLVTQALLPLLQRAEHPRIIMISSNAASCTNRTKPGTYSYGASKAALNMISRNLSADLGPDGPIVICVHPGHVQTDMTKGTGEATPAQAAADIAQLINDAGTHLRGAFVDRHGETLPW